MQRSALEVVGEVGAPWTEGERVVALLAPLAVLAVVVAAVGLGAAVELLIGAAGGPLALLLVVGLLVAAGLATRHALGRDIRSLKSSPTPGQRSDRRPARSCS
jgi:fatty acid desaturase